MAQRTPLSEQRRLVALWHQSNLSMTRFAASVGVPDTTFWRWTRKHATDRHAVSKPAFVEVTERAAVAPVVEPFAVRMQVQGQRAVALSFDGRPDASWLGAVLREVTTC